MTVSYFVRYEGEAKNASAFIEHYRTQHAPILARFPGIRELVLHTPIDWHDPCPVHPGNFVLLAQMVFDSREELLAALASSLRFEAREDFASFPPFDGEVFHQAMAGETLYSNEMTAQKSGVRF